MVEGVGSYLLMKNDGRILSHNVADPDSLSSLMAVSGLGIKKIQESMGFQHFNHFLVKQDNKENLLLLKMGSVLLGVIQKLDRVRPVELFESFKKKKKKK